MPVNALIFFFFLRMYQSYIFNNTSLYRVFSDKITIFITEIMILSE